MHDVFMDCTKCTLNELQSFGEGLAVWQRGMNWWIGDVARYAKARFPDTWNQVFPEWMSPGLVSRCIGVSEAYPNESDRNPDATWHQHMQVAGRPDRIALVCEMVENGQTSDESRGSLRGAVEPEKRPAAAANQEPESTRSWILCIDCNYYLHRFWHSGADVESAKGVAAWIKGTIERLREKGLTDVACCFDAPNNHRKELTKDWEDKYKDRKQKEPELVNQIHLLRDLLEKAGFASVSLESMEADDVMASYAKQFPGRVTLLTQDKDQRQCLSEKCNILLDVTWKRDEHSGDAIYEYKWLTAKTHFEQTGLTPKQFIDYQCIMGDNVDGIRGVEGIGEKGAADLVKRFQTVESAIQAAKDEFPEIPAKKRKALIEFAPKLEVTRQLVTLRDDLEVPSSTRLT